MNKYISKKLKNFIIYNIPNYINQIQDVRNESAHGDSPLLSEIEAMRANIIGISSESIISSIVEQREMFK